MEQVTWIFASREATLGVIVSIKYTLIKYISLFFSLRVYSELEEALNARCI